MSYTSKFKVDVPEGESGAWRVERFTVDKQAAQAEAMRSVFSGGRGVPEGTYTRLMRGRTVVMSDTPDEIRDHNDVFFKVKVSRRVSCGFKPRCLVHGLGLGMVARGVLLEGAEHVTVVEKSPDVIKLVGPWLRKDYGDQVAIIEGDAFTWKPPKGAYWDIVWHDIWDYITADNLPEMHKLHRRFGRRSDWQGSWARPECERAARAWKREQRAIRFAGGIDFGSE